MLRAIVLITTLLMPTLVVSQTTRPGSMNDTQPIIIPETGLPAPQAAPAPAPPPEPQKPIPFGGFRPLDIEPPGVDKLYAMRQATLRTRDGVLQVPYLDYDPGGPTSLTRDPIIIAAPEGQDLYGLVELVDLRLEARRQGRALLAITIPQTPGQTSGRVEDIARQALAAREDGVTAGRYIDAVLQAESLFGRPTIVGAEGMGTVIQDYLCQAQNSNTFPIGIFLMDGGLRADTAAQCDAPRLPRLAIVQSAEDTAVPYAGGESAPVPGQPNSRVLSAPQARSFWALAARCSDEPDLKWIAIKQGRLAMETHNRCSRGGPVTLLTMIEGNLSEEQLSTLAATFVNGELFQ